MAQILVACSHRHSILFWGRCLENSFVPPLWKRDNYVFHSFGNRTVLKPGGGQTPRFQLVQPQWQGNLAPSQYSLEQNSSFESKEKFMMIYRFPGIRICRFFSRLKLFQTTFTIVILPPIWFSYWINQVTFSQGLYATGVACLAVVMLYAISFFLRRIIGFMYLNESGTLLKVAHLTFWGRRRDFCCPVKSVMTLGDLGEDKNKFFLTFRQFDKKEFLYFSLRFGQIVDHKAFATVFGHFC